MSTTEELRNPCFAPGQQHLGQPVIPIILLLIAVSLIAVFGLLVSTFNSLDDLARENLYEDVRVGLDVETDRQESLLQEFSFWDEAHENLILHVDSEWADQNIGSYMSENYGIDLSMALSTDGAATIAYFEGELAETTPRIPDNSDVGLLIAKLTKSQAHKVSGFIDYEGEAFLASIAFFKDEESEDPKGDGSLLLIAQRLDKVFVETVGETYQLQGLRLVPGDAAADMVLAGLDKTPLAGLAWDKAKPNGDFFQQLILPVVLVFVVMAVLSWLILSRERRNRQKYNDHLCELASKDFLTGISNRREFFFLANREMTRAKRESRALSVLMMDLDHFKSINDSFGHDVGDQVLAGFARIVKDNLRDFDVFARLGGEEFAALLVGSTQAEALDTAQRLCDLVAANIFTVSEGSSLRCTVSIGLATWNAEEAVDKLLNRADDALYEAKRNGRNRVGVAEFS